MSATQYCHSYCHQWLFLCTLTRRSCNIDSLCLRILYLPPTPLTRLHLNGTFPRHFTPTPSARGDGGAVGEGPGSHGGRRIDSSNIGTQVFDSDDEDFLLHPSGNGVAGRAIGPPTPKDCTRKSFHRLPEMSEDASMSLGREDSLSATDRERMQGSLSLYLDSEFQDRGDFPDGDD